MMFSPHVSLTSSRLGQLLRLPLFWMNLSFLRTGLGSQRIPLNEGLPWVSLTVRLGWWGRGGQSQG